MSSITILSPGETKGHLRVPRSRWSYMTTREFLRITEREPASEELLQEMRLRLDELAYQRGN